MSVASSAVSGRHAQCIARLQVLAKPHADTATPRP